MAGMESTTAAKDPVPHPRLSETLQLLLSSSERQGPLTLGALLKAMGERSVGLSLILLSLPSALPVPAPGYSIPFGLLLMFGATQIIIGRKTVWIPERAARWQISEGLAGKMLRGATRFFARAEHLIKPRWALVQKLTGNVLTGSLVFLMGLLMVIPLPFTNTLPAIVIFLFGVALTEKDGLLTSLTSLLGILVAVFYTVLFLMMFYFGLNGVREAYEILRGQIM